MTWTSPKPPTMTFDGFRSRWITPRAWAIGHRLADLLEDRRAAACGPRPGPARSARSAARVRPLTSFMVKYGRRSAKRPQLVDRHDAGVLELAGDLGLLDEPADQLGVVAVLLQQDLDGQVAAEVDVAALEHGPHAAAGDLAEELEAGRAVGRVGHLGRGGLDHGSTPEPPSVSRSRTRGMPPSVSASAARTPARPRGTGRLEGGGHLGRRSRAFADRARAAPIRQLGQSPRGASSAGGPQSGQAAPRLIVNSPRSGRPPAISGPIHYSRASAAADNPARRGAPRSPDHLGARPPPATLMGRAPRARSRHHGPLRAEPNGPLRSPTIPHYGPGVQGASVHQSWPGRGMTAARHLQPGRPCPSRPHGLRRVTLGSPMLRRLGWPGPGNHSERRQAIASRSGEWHGRAITEPLEERAAELINLSLRLRRQAVAVGGRVWLYRGRGRRRHP